MGGLAIRAYPLCSEDFTLNGGPTQLAGDSVALAFGSLAECLKPTVTFEKSAFYMRCKTQ